MLSRYSHIPTIPIKNNLLFFSFMYLLGIICSVYVNNFSTHLTVELFLDIYMVCVLLEFLPIKIKIVCRFLLYIIAYVLTFVDVYCYTNLGSFISPTLLQILMQTNYNETIEAVRSYATLDFLNAKIISIA